MAGNWIKFETATSDKPEVWAIADELCIDPDAVVGKLLRVWSWFDDQSENGNAPIVTKSLLDRKVSVTGFCDAMIRAGWLTEDDEQIALPNFDRHTGKTAKNRALTAKRVAKSKAKGNEEDNAEVTPDALPREEKNREDIKQPPVVPQGDAGPNLETVMQEYNRVLGDQLRKSLKPTKARHRALKARISESAKRKDLSWWTQYFEHCRDSDFLMGRVQPRPGHENWQADLDWLLNESNMVKIIEGKYHGNLAGGHPYAPSQRPDNSAVGRVRANIERDRAQRERAPQGGNALVPDDPDVWPPLGQ